MRFKKESDLEKKLDSHRLLLINPPSGFLIDERVFLPLGIANIASVAQERGHDVTLIDLAAVGNYKERIKEEVRKNGYDAVGITATSPQFYYAYDILKEIKQEKPELKVIIGGSHSSMFSALRKSLITRFSKEGLSGNELEQRLYEEDPNFSKLEEFDVIADGEESSLEAALATKDKWVNGMIESDLDSLPLPARELFDVNSYLFDPQGTPKFKINGKPSGSLISQRGCPYACEFCCGRDSAMYKQVKLPGGILRAHSSKRILKELDSMNEQFGLESFMFYDDEFNLHPKRTLDLCEALKSRDYRFRGFIKSDLLVDHPEVATAMKNAGFSEVLTGVESGSERILSRHLHKRTSPEINYRAAMICLENGMGFKALTMAGHPSETPKDIMATRDWLLKVGKEYNAKLGPGNFTFDLTVFQPYAGCPIWDRAVKNSGEFSDEFNWLYQTTTRKGEVIDSEYGGMYFNKVDFSTEHGFYKGIPGTYKAFIRTKYITSEQFVKLRDSIEWEIRDKLKMPQLTDLTPSMQYEHSMGQGSTQAVKNN